MGTHYRKNERVGDVRPQSLVAQGPSGGRKITEAKEVGGKRGDESWSGEGK